MFVKKNLILRNKQKENPIEKKLLQMKILKTIYEIDFLNLLDFCFNICFYFLMRK